MKERIATYLFELVGVVAETLHKIEELTPTGALFKNCVAFQDQMPNPEHTPMGGSQSKQQETLHFPNTQCRDLIGEDFLSPWLQETGQGCLSFFF